MEADPVVEAADVRGVAHHEVIADVERSERRLYAELYADL